MSSNLVYVVIPEFKRKVEQINFDFGFTWVGILKESLITDYKEISD